MQQLNNLMLVRGAVDKENAQSIMDTIIASADLSKNLKKNLRRSKGSTFEKIRNFRCSVLNNKWRGFCSRIHSFLTDFQTPISQIHRSTKLDLFSRKSPIKTGISKIISTGLLKTWEVELSNIWSFREPKKSPKNHFHGIFAVLLILSLRLDPLKSSILCRIADSAEDRRLEWIQSLREDQKCTKNPMKMIFLAIFLFRFFRHQTSANHGWYDFSASYFLHRFWSPKTSKSRASWFFDYFFFWTVDI